MRLGRASERPRARPNAATRGPGGGPSPLGPSSLGAPNSRRHRPFHSPHRAPGRFHAPARRATYPTPLTLPGPPPLAQSLRRLLGGSRRAGGVSGARARGPDVRPAGSVGGKPRGPLRWARWTSRVVPPSEPEPSPPREKRKTNKKPRKVLASNSGFGHLQLCGPWRWLRQVTERLQPNRS